LARNPPPHFYFINEFGMNRVGEFKRCATSFEYCNVAALGCVSIPLLKA
jgi:hypothetical protein